MKVFLQLQPFLKEYTITSQKLLFRAFFDPIVGFRIDRFQIVRTQKESHLNPKLIQKNEYINFVSLMLLIFILNNTIEEKRLKGCLK